MGAYECHSNFEQTAGREDVFIMSKQFYTSESVTEGHPDKICDTLADTILDAFLEKDKFARVDCSALATHGIVVISGEVTTKGYIDLHTLVRGTIKRIGYDSAELGFDYRSLGILALIREQSEQLGRIVDLRMAGDQGMMVGYATDEARHLGCFLEYMPVPIMIAHMIMKKLSDVRKEGIFPFLRPDGKGYVTMLYENGMPRDFAAIGISAQHSAEISLEGLRTSVMDQVIKPVFNSLNLSPDEKTIQINPGGPFIDGGPLIDTGESGRKIIVDSYGGAARHGGSSFSGKDPTKLDRSGAYFARYLAKNIVAAGAASKCEVHLAYFTGSPEPVSVAVNTYGSGEIADDRITDFITDNFDLTPAGILEKLDLRRPIYKSTSAYGHFGRSDYDYPWEKCDLKDLFTSMGGGGN